MAEEVSKLENSQPTRSEPHLRNSPNLAQPYASAARLQGADDLSPVRAYSHMWIRCPVLDRELAVAFVSRDPKM